MKGKNSAPLPAMIESESKLKEFEQAYELSRDFVRKSIYWMVRSSAVDELVQDTYVKAWKNFDQFEKRSTFNTWIYRIAMNITYDYLRKNKRENSHLIHVQNQAKESSELGALDFSDENYQITQGLELLTIEQREVFVLYFKFGYTLNECSQLLEQPEGTIKTRVYKAKEIFIEFINQTGENDE